jgi:hypothetical protein
MPKTRNYLAIDLGAESGRTVLGTLEDGILSLTETHRFPNGPVRLPNGIYWDVLRLWEEIKTEIELPQAVPELKDATFIVSGSGRRLREIIDEPVAHLACLVVNEGGKTAKLYSSLLRKLRIVIWAKPGVTARSDVSVKRATDRIEFAEVAAKYEYQNLTAGEIAEGLSADEIRDICRAFNVQQNFF